jgi:hypothetical protein
MRRKSWILPMIAAVAALLTPLAAAPASAAASAHQVKPAMVLVNQPFSTVCVGRSFRVGVWYQQLSGGSRAYRVAVYNPRGRRILYKHGRAPSGQWKFWSIHPKLTGRYHTVYSGHWKQQSVWTKYRVTTRSRQCGPRA